MTKSKSLGLSALFLAIALFVSTALVMTLHQNYAGNGSSPPITDALQLLQKGLDGMRLMQCRVRSRRHCIDPDILR